MSNTLLKSDKAGLVPAWFPSTMQAFIFRNWGMVDKSRLAKVLGTSEENVVRETKRMGLGEQGDLSLWPEKGYITIIRANWHLLQPQMERLMEMNVDHWMLSWTLGG